MNEFDEDITGHAENAAADPGDLDVGMQIVTKPFAITAPCERIKGAIDS